MGHKQSLETRKKISDTLLGKKKTKLHRENISKARKSLPFISKPNQSVFAKTRFGEKSANWKGGITKELKLLRTCSKYKVWREAVFWRDDFTCQDCGQFGGCLEAHHIESFAQVKESRFELSNGITYCKSCHAKNDKFRGIGNSMMVLNIQRSVN